MRKTRIQPIIIKESQTLKADGCNSLTIRNQGESTVFIEDNIGLAPGEEFNWSNDPDVVIDMNLLIRFTGAGTNKALIIKIYVK